MSLALEARDLRVHHPQFPHLNGVDLQLAFGKTIAIGGAHDSGQSTLLQVCAGLLPHGEGDLYLLGLSYQTNPRKIREQIGIFSVDSYVDKDLTVAESLTYHCMNYGLSRRDSKVRLREALRQVHLETYEQTAILDLPASEARMFHLARATVTKPKLLFLDRPGHGLSGQYRNLMVQAVQNHLRDGGATVVFMDHPTDLTFEIDQLVLLSKGRMVAGGSPKDLMNEYASPEVLEFSLAPTEREYYLNKIRDRYRYQIYQNQVRMYLGSQQDYKDVLRLISSDRILVRKPSIDDIYLNASGETFGEADL